MNLIYFHIGDYSQGTARLTPEQDGIYLRLLMEYYKTEKPLGDNLDKLAFLMGCQTKRLKDELKFVLDHFFVKDEAQKCWVHKRVEREIANYRVDGVQKRYAILCRHWEKVNSGHKKPTFEEFSASPSRYYDDATGRIRVVTGRKPLVLDSYSDGSTGDAPPNYPPVPSTQEPVPSNQESTPVVPKGTPTVEALAEAIYGIYPRKEGKKAAIKAIVKVLKAGEVTELELQATVSRYSAAVAKWPEQDRTFIPHPATWFNQGRYLDDPATWIRDPDSAAKKKNGGAGAAEERPLFAMGAADEPEAPEDWELAMRALFGEDWQTMYAAWGLMPAADQRQVRVWLERNRENIERAKGGSATGGAK